jgi:hypothetical protein
MIVLVKHMRGRSRHRAPSGSELALGRILLVSLLAWAMVTRS